MPLKRVLYLSRAAEAMTSTDVEAIVKVSQVQNRSKGITGFLTYGEGVFMQVLEGEEEPVTELMDSITADKRHDDLIVLEDGLVSERLFPTWNMAMSHFDLALLKKTMQAPLHMQTTYDVLSNQDSAYSLLFAVYGAAQANHSPGVSN